MKRKTANNYQLETNLLRKWPAHEHKRIRHLPHSLFTYLGITDASEASLRKLRVALRKQPRLRTALAWYNCVADSYYEHEAQQDRINLLGGLTCIDLLEVLPEFRQLAAMTRRTFEIEPVANLKRISGRVSIDLFYYANLAKHDPDYFKLVMAPVVDSANEHGRANTLPSNRDITSASKILIRFEKSPGYERQEVLRPFLREFRLNRSMQQWIFDYLLYDIKQGSLLNLSRYKMPLQCVRKDDNGDQYIELRVYDDTDFLGWLRKPGNTGHILETQLGFGLIREGRWQQTIGLKESKQPWHKSKSMEIFLREFVYCQQILLTGKDNAQANDFLLKNGLKQVPFYHNSQVIRRYRKRFTR